MTDMSFRNKSNNYYPVIKGILDRLLAGLLLLILGIPMVCMGLLIRLDSPGPALFRQRRIGKDGKAFWMRKFRSMKMGAEQTGTGVYSERGDPRVTRMGSWMRTTSLDELPQLINIIRGEMAFVGPRPPLLYHPWIFEAYTEEQKKMFTVLPGLTGWAQVHGRKGVEWHNRIEMNVWYVEHLSFWLDMKIIGMTVKTLLNRSGNFNRGKTVKADQTGRL